MYPNNNQVGSALEELQIDVWNGSYKWTDLLRNGKITRSRRLTWHNHLLLELLLVFP